VTALRLFALLAVASAAGVGAALVSRAQAVEPPVVARIPAIPSVDALASTRCPIPPRLRDAFVDASAETELPLALLTAVAQVEPRSSPSANVLTGARYLRSQFDRFRSSNLALAAYHAGPSAVGTNEGTPRDDTLTYVADVTAVWRALAGCG
jgi:soluble lytic murein transglycosylase-like protein